MVMLIADGGQMTVGRRAGTFVYGSFQVILPEGREKQQEDNRLQDGYISRPPGQTRGRFDITFVRADATVDLGANVSDLETVIDTAQKRVAGDTFFERDITGPGLGRWRPGLDYDTGDLIDVLIWGKVMELPVTSIDMTSGDRGRAGWRVHVGGQLISDAVTLRRHNDDLAQQIARERQERLAQLEKQQNFNIEQAQSTATAAQEAAQAAQAAADAAAADAGRYQEHAVELQSVVEDLQAVRARREWRLLTTSDDYWVVNSDSTVTARPGWVGRLLTWSRTSRTERVRDGDNSSTTLTLWTPTYGNDRVPAPDGSRTFPAGSIMLYQVAPGIQRWHTPTPVRVTDVPQATWHRITALDWQAPQTGEYSLTFTVGWDAATYDNNYGIAVMAGGTEVLRLGPRSKVGPMFHFQDGYSQQSVNNSKLRFTAGQSITFWVYATNSPSRERLIRDATVRISWIEEEQ